MAESILWYDLETFGLDPAWDRVAQFACIRTSTDLELLPENDDTMLYCKPGLDSLPDPKSCLITGIGPTYCNQIGMSEYDFFSTIRSLMMKNGTCSAGFNSIRFDDEFVRYGLYRNLYDPYEREWLDGNSRWDLLDIFRAAADLRPEGLVWPRDTEGKLSFRLEALTAANGIEHSAAHDARADVIATIELARKLRQAQPRFFDWAFKHRTKAAVRKLVDIHKRLPFVHVSGMFGNERGHTSLVAPIAVQPGNANCILCYDLRYRPEELISLSPEEIRERIFTTNEELTRQGKARIHLKGVHINKSPFVAPTAILEESGMAEKLGIDLPTCRQNWQKLQADPHLMQKVMKVYEREGRHTQSTDPDAALYEGFFSDHDRTYLEAVRWEADKPQAVSITAETILEMSRRLTFDDRKLGEMVRRFACRNFTTGLPTAEAARWRSFCASRLLMPPENRTVNLDFYKRKVDENLADQNLDARAKPVLRDLADWAQHLEHEVLSWPGQPS